MREIEKFKKKTKSYIEYSRIIKRRNLVLEQSNLIPDLVSPDTVKVIKHNQKTTELLTLTRKEVWIHQWDQVTLL